MWTHLERQKGGIGMRGPGETQIETDRRIIKDKIALLKKKLEKIDKQSLTRRKGRADMIRVALVGYTNAGKSTLMNKLSKSEIRSCYRIEFSSKLQEHFERKLTIFTSSTKN